MKALLYFTAILFLMEYSNAQNCPPASAYDFIDVNNVKARINNGGDMWWDLFNDAQYIVPKSGNASALFAGALWIGGVDAQGQLRLAAQTYRLTGNDFFPGPLDENGNVSNQACDNFDRIWKVSRSEIDSVIQLSQLYGSNIPFNLIPASILEWPGLGNPYFAPVGSVALAPFMDTDGNEYYDATGGDYPNVPGDQALWFVFNDKGNTHSETGASQIGIEVQCTVYAFEGSGTCLNNTTFYHYQLINKSSESLNSTYAGLWLDPDIGCFNQNYFGCDTLNNLGIIYNSDTPLMDVGCELYAGSNPPVLAVDFLKGPEDENGNIHYLDHFIGFGDGPAGSGNPGESEDYYDGLHSVYPNGSHLVNPQGEETDFLYPGDPADPQGWSMCTENVGSINFRMLASSGPFQFDPGDVKTLDLSLVWDNTSIYPCPSFSTIIGVADCAENYFKANVQFTPVTVVQTALNNGFEIFPNPLLQGDVMNITVTNSERIEIVDVAGRVMETIASNNQTSIQINPNLSKGIYFVKLIFRNHQVKTEKLIVQ